MEEKKIVCRVCLSADRKKYVSLFTKHYEQYIVDQINSVANVHIKEGDGFPDKICRSCLSDLETAISFKQKCEGSNIILHNTVTTQPADLDLEFDVKNIVVKKEEPLEPDERCMMIEYIEDNVFQEDNTFETDEKPLLLDNETPVRKSKAIDLKLQCDDCGNFFKSKCKLRVHWKRVHLIQNLFCQECKRRFKSVVAYKNHQKNKKQNCLAAKNFRIEGEGRQRVFYCKECDYKSLRMKDIITHSVVHTGDRPFKCDLCPKTCTQLSSLTAHKETAHQIYKQEITCQYCGKLLKGRNKIYRHLKTHADNSVQCQICQKTLKNRAILAQHLQRHTGYKSYTCEKCAHSFYTFAELSNHKRQVHNKDKKLYTCSLCDYKSSRKESVKKHEARHTDGTVPCTVCGMFFECQQKLVIHQRRHFEEKKYPCPYCECKFFRRDTVPKHVKAKHAEIFQRSKRTVGFTVNDKGIEKRDIEIYVIGDIPGESVSPVQINDDDM